MKTLFLFFLLFLVCYRGSSEVVTKFKYVEFKFKTEKERMKYVDEKVYERVTLAGIKADSNGTMYVSMPRWKGETPATLGKLVKVGGNMVVDAFPSWELNNLTTSGGLKSVLGFEIDSKDRMWILDQGKVGANPAKKGAIKLIVWDLKNNVEIIRHVFSASQASPMTSFLNDIVVNDVDEIAYISDSGKPIDPKQPNDAAILVARWEKDTLNVTRYLERHYSVSPNNTFTMKGEHCNAVGPTGVDGIALSCDYRALYWTPLSSRKLYGVETTYFNHPDYLEDMVVTLGEKGSNSDGLGCSNKYKLYLTQLEKNSVQSMNEIILGILVEERSGKKMPPFTNVTNEKIQWPDTIGWNSVNNSMLLVSNNLCDFLSNNMDFTQYNFFVHSYKMESGEGSYVLGCKSRGFRFGASEVIALIALSGLFLFGFSLTIISGCVLGKVGEFIRRKKDDQQRGMYAVQHD